MRRGSSNAISPTNFGWDSGWHGRNVKDLGSRIDNVHNERRSSGFDPRSSASISSDHMEPTFSSPPHQHKKRLEHKGGMKLKRSGSAPRRRRSSLGTTESWEALKRTQQQQSYHQPRARPQKQRPLSLSSTYHSSSSNSNNSNSNTAVPPTAAPTTSSTRITRTPSFGVEQTGTLTVGAKDYTVSMTRRQRYCADCADCAGCADRADCADHCFDDAAANNTNPFACIFVTMQVFEVKGRVVWR